MTHMEITMPVKIIDGYEVEFTAEPLEGCDSWGAYVSIFAPSDNPMHMTIVYPKQRVSADLELSNSVLRRQRRKVPR